MFNAGPANLKIEIDHVIRDILLSREKITFLLEAEDYAEHFFVVLDFTGIDILAHVLKTAQQQVRAKDLIADALKSKLLNIYDEYTSNDNIKQFGDALIEVHDAFILIRSKFDCIEITNAIHMVIVVCFVNFRLMNFS